MAVLVLVAVALSATPAGAADPEPAPKKESKPWWRYDARDAFDDAKGPVGAAVDKVFPGDSVAEKAGSVMTGESPLSPFHAADEAAEATVEVAKETADTAAEQNLPGYAQLKDGFGGASELVDKVPGGWRTVSLAGIVLLLYLLFRSGAPQNATKVAVRQRFPVAAAYAGGRKPPKRRPTPTRREPLLPRTSEWSHTGKPGKSEVVAGSIAKLTVCADTTGAARAAAKRRWVGWDVHPAGTEYCDMNPEKVHVDFLKKRSRRAA